jgi:hypothetical protein
MVRWRMTRCSLCGSRLTSPRSIRLGIGQRCKWKRDGKPTRQRTTTQGQGMPIDDVNFTESGGNYYQRKLYEAFQE